MKHLLLIAVFFSTQYSFAQFYTTVQDGNFTDPATWDAGVPPLTSSHVLVINHHVVMDTNDTFCGSLTVNTGGSIQEDGTPRLMSVGTFINSGTITITSFNSSGSSDENHGNLNVTRTTNYFGNLKNYGTYIATGDIIYYNGITNFSGATVACSGTLGGAVFINQGYFDVDSFSVWYYVDNYATLNINYMYPEGGIFNAGQIDIQWNLYHNDSIFNKAGGELTVHGNFNRDDSMGLSTRWLVNEGEFEVQGGFTNNMDMNNNGVFRVLGNAENKKTLQNNGYFETGGTFTNKSIVDVFSSGNLTVKTDFLNGVSGGPAGTVTNGGDVKVTRDLINRGVFSTGKFCSTGRNFTNWSSFVNEPTGLMVVEGDFLNESGAPPGGTFTANGFHNVYGDFSNKSVMDGSGRFCVWLTSTNNGMMSGTFDFCDKTGDSLDVNTGTFGPGHTVCSFPCAVGVTPPRDTRTLTISPNPTSGTVVITVSSSQGHPLIDASDMRVFALNGQNVTHLVQIRGSGNAIHLDFSTLERGLYVVQLVSDGKVWAERVMVQ